MRRLLPSLFLQGLRLLGKRGLWLGSCNDRLCVPLFIGFLFPDKASDAILAKIKLNLKGKGMLQLRPLILYGKLLAPLLLLPSLHVENF